VSPTPNHDAMVKGTWVNWMLRIIGERIRNEQLELLLRPTNEVTPT